MTQEKSPAQLALDDVNQHSVTSVLRPIGFRKSSLNFHRRQKEVVQVVNLQMSRGSSWETKRFYVNVGLTFDSLCNLTGTAILEKPKEHECDNRGTRARMQKLIDGVPDEWIVSTDKNNQDVADSLHLAIEKLAVAMNGIDSVESYRHHAWFDRFRPKRENAQILYLLGDMEAAKGEVDSLCELFADREGANRASWWIEQLGLRELATDGNL